ncbi:hypothetical protein SynMVIR181_00846 [Synechococcus sp. MVIR-18-1]|nr:hypothetical protein SynMVIR181_00846 [Synechococcus sp. MVIR-18-1]
MRPEIANSKNATLSIKPFSLLAPPTAQKKSMNSPPNGLEDYAQCQPIFESISVIRSQCHQ